MLVCSCALLLCGKQRLFGTFISLSGNLLRKLCRVKGKGNVHPRTVHEGPEEEQKYSSTLSLTSALDGGGCQRYAPAALLPGKTQYPLYRRLGGTLGRCGRVRKTSPRPGFDPRTVQPVASSYNSLQQPQLYVAYTFVLLYCLGQILRRRGRKFHLENSVNQPSLFPTLTD